MSEELLQHKNVPFIIKLLPIVVIIAIVGALIALMAWLQPEANKKKPNQPVPLYEVIALKPEAVTLTVRTQGTARPRTETTLVAEVTGQIIWVSPNLESGGAFTKGDVLAKIDPADYEAALAARKAELASAKLALAQEKALAEQAKQDWERLGKGDPSDLTLRKPQLEQARAAVESAEAAVAKAQRDLDKTQVRVPYDGRVLEKMADIGQFVVGGAQANIASIYNTDTTEVRLPLTMRQLKHAGLADGFSATAMAVTLRSNGQSWQGVIDRLEGAVDPRSRLRYAVAQVTDTGAPLKRGTYVEAQIEGISIENAFVLPRYALRANGTVYLVKPTGNENKATMHRVSVEVVQTTPDIAIVQGLPEDALICTSPVNLFIDGMTVEYKLVEAAQ